MRKYLKFIVLILVAVFIFWFFGRNLDWQEVSASLKKADPWWLGLGFLGICFGYFLRAVRWQVLLEPITPSKLGALFATTTVGFAAMFIVGRAGEIVRPMWLPMLDRRVRPSAALVTVFVERVFDLASLICFFSISLIWFRVAPGHESEVAPIKLAGNIMLGVTVIGFACLVIYHRLATPVNAWFEKLTDRKFVPKRLRELFLGLLDHLATSLDILKSPRGLFLATFWTIALWFSIALPTYCVLRAFNLDLGVVGGIFVMGVASLGSLIPTPGGAAGAFHAATAGSLIILGVDRETAAAVSIVMHLVYFAPAVLFGLYYLFRGDISINKFRSLLSSENAEREIESDSPDFEPEH